MTLVISIFLVLSSMCSYLVALHKIEIIILNTAFLSDTILQGIYIAPYLYWIQCFTKKNIYNGQKYTQQTQTSQTDGFWVYSWKCPKFWPLWCWWVTSSIRRGSSAKKIYIVLVAWCVKFIYVIIMLSCK